MASTPRRRHKRAPKVSNVPPAPTAPRSTPPCVNLRPFPALDAVRALLCVIPLTTVSLPLHRLLTRHANRKSSRLLRHLMELGFIAGAWELGACIRLGIPPAAAVTLNDIACRRRSHSIAALFVNIGSAATRQLYPITRTCTATCRHLSPFQLRPTCRQPLHARYDATR